MANFSLEKKATLHFYQQCMTQPPSPLPRQQYNLSFNSANLVNEEWSLKAFCCFSSLNFGESHTFAAYLYFLCDLLLTVFAYGSESVSCSVVSDSLRPHGLWPPRLLCPWDSPGKNTGVGCHFLFQCMKVKRESEVAQSCPTLRDPMDTTFHFLFKIF